MAFLCHAVSSGCVEVLTRPDICKLLAAGQTREEASQPSILCSIMSRFEDVWQSPSIWVNIKNILKLHREQPFGKQRLYQLRKERNATK